MERQHQGDMGLLREIQRGFMRNARQELDRATANLEQAKKDKQATEQDYREAPTLTTYDDILQLHDVRIRELAEDIERLNRMVKGLEEELAESLA